MKIKKLKENCYVIIDNKNNKYLVSYESIIAKIDNKGVLSLGKNWAYSNTTSKYIGWFIEEITGQKMNKGIIEKLIKQGDILIDETL